MSSRNHSARAGFTLIEMMISAFILALITVYMTSALLQQSRGYEVVDDVAEAQQAERAIGDLLERDVLATGMLVAAGAVIAGVDNATPAGGFATDVLCVTDPGAVQNPTVESNADLGIEVTLGYTGSGTDTLTLADTTLDGAPSYDNSNPANGSLDSDFYFSPGSGQAGGLIITHPDPARGAQCGLITDVAGNQVRVSWQINFNGQDLVPAGSETPINTLGARPLAVPAHIYFIRPAAAGRAPQLIRDGLLLADDVEDLQVAYFHDDVGVIPNGTCDANEWSGGDCPAPGVQGFNAYDSSAKDNCFLRAVRFNLVVRTADQDT
ncbi:MAG TPA: prepilin-type N-terminal cleavage/methylation domain-containing protein, partial [Myxococcota bacterium]|nr:prepilin-type N-terminal cleavage/methylation domain-containing protein [Myxococcota bacterium]